MWVLNVSGVQFSRGRCPVRGMHGQESLLREPCQSLIIDGGLVLGNRGKRAVKIREVDASSRTCLCTQMKWDLS